MISNLTETGWEVIYHRAHALLAAQIAGQWKKSESPLRLYETIAAISHHDDLEREWEGNELTEAGAPLDFTLIKETSIPQLRELTENSRYRGRWVALLTSMHVSFLTEGKRGESPELDQFLDEQLKNQEKWRQELQIKKEDTEAAYAFFQFCDRLSLILGNHNLPAGERALEIAKGPEGTRYDILQRADGKLTVMPWPFDPEKFTVNVEACELNQLKFEDNEQLRTALKTAPIKILEWTFVK